MATWEKNNLDSNKVEVALGKFSSVRTCLCTFSCSLTPPGDQVEWSQGKSFLGLPETGVTLV